MSSKTLILGLGNTILGDDGVGIYASRKISEECADLTNLDVVEASLGGIGLIDLMTGYDRVIILDAILTGKNKPGTIYQLPIDDLCSPSQMTNQHFLDVRTSVELGRKIGLTMPETIIIFGVEIKDNTTFSDELTHEVKHALPSLVEHVLHFVQENQ